VSQSAATAREMPAARAPARNPPRMAVLAGPDYLTALTEAGGPVQDLTGLAPPDIVSRHGGGLIVIEQGRPGWDQLLLQLAVEQPTTAVVMLSDQLPAHMVRTLMKLQAWDILSVSSAPEDVIDAAARLEEGRAEPQGKAASSVCWAFRGAVGGAGVSTLAIESAFALARVTGPGQVCLVDLNLADGMTSSFLEAVPKLDLHALSAAPERLDARLLAAWCWQHDGGVAIITAPRNPDADLLASEAAVLRLLDVACTSFPFVIVDMPRHMMPWTKPVLAAVDEVVIVSELTVPSLHAAADMCRDVDVLRGDTSKARLVLNRMFQKKQFRAGFPVGKAEEAIERKIDVTITSDWDAARTAVNLGKPIADVKPKSPLVLDVDKMVRLLAPAGMIANSESRKSKKKAKP